MTASATTPDDPRTRTDGLGWVTRAVFGDERVALTVGGRPPAGHRVVTRYAVVPSLERARFLLPLGAPRATAASLLAYNALRPPKVRAVRAVLGGIARLRGIEVARFPTLTVSLPDGVAADEALLAHRLAALLGGAPAYAACGVRPPDPNHKPTLQLFGADGRPLGYAKIGWNGATRALVTAEAAALRELPVLAGVPGHPVAPRLLAETAWAGQVVALVEPLPSDVRGVPVTDPPEVAAVLAVARRGRPPAPPRPLAGSTFLDRLTATAERAAAATPEGARAVAAVAALARRHGGTAVEFGHWHGDWVPWNLGRHAGRLVAWDWEHSGPDVPLGFDLAHDAFQRALVLRGEPAAVAAGAVDVQLDRYGDALGLEPAGRRLVADSYLLEMWLRTWRLADAGAGWNSALHPALLDVADMRHNG
ncbi:hypothetical protein [Micromonospora thermarum]|uniref:Phosphotransferase enzyme family protein n=1 Tax=Micromonospora thermarum TaxID=2720024 RepID=A0ABX0ZBI7_9ACTN|nr:hypothetical protein [Micromonospora thermarum]NJP33829.1 hypothetical protein [Micromonospora thermarum]